MYHPETKNIVSCAYDGMWFRVTNAQTAKVISDSHGVDISGSMPAVFLGPDRQRWKAVAVGRYGEDVELDTIH
jgi:hypothetical protein